MYKTTKHVHIHISEDKNGFFGGFLAPPMQDTGTKSTVRIPT